jgi:hypothetical protein
MSASTETQVSGNTNSGWLKIYVDEVLQTTYEYGPGSNFVLSPRLNDVVLDRSEFRSSVDDIDQWRAMLARHCTFVDAWAPHTLHVEDKETRTTFRLRFGEAEDVLAIHAIVQKGSPETECRTIFAVRNSCGCA